MSGPVLPGESPADIARVRCGRPSGALLPFESPAIAELARLAYLQGIADAEFPESDLCPFD